MKQVFIINGSGGVGKDTFVDFVSEKMCTENYSSVDKVKEIAKVIGWDGGKTEKDRKFLSDLKLLTTEYNDMPFQCMKKRVNKFYEDSIAVILFLHIREPEEIERAVKEFDAKTILIKRDNIKHIKSNMADENVFNYNYDIIIENNGTLDDFKEAANSFTENFLKNEI